LRMVVVYPVPVDLVDRLLIENRNVFVKYLPHTTKNPLQQGDKVIFYASHHRKELVGEGIVEKAEFLSSEEAISRYGEKIFLSRDELTAYTRQQPSRDSSKKLLVAVLTKLTKYKKGIVYPKLITMAGEYLTKEQYKKLLAKQAFISVNSE